MHDYYQLNNIKYITDKYGNEQWIQVAGERKLNNSDASFWCCLFQIEYLDDIMSTSEWDASYSDGYPGFIPSMEGTVFQRFIIHKDYVEPILFYREFYGVKKNYVEISEEFRLLNNMYFDQQNNSYYAVLDSGNCEEAIRILENDTVYINIKYLKRFASAKQMGILLFFDIRYETPGLLSDNNLTKIDKEHKDTTLVYKIFGNEERTFQQYTFSRLLGKKALLPPPIIECGYFPYEKKRTYVEFIIWHDENGCEVTFTSYPDKLSNYFGANSDAPNYMTLVFLKERFLINILSVLTCIK